MRRLLWLMVLAVFGEVTCLMGCEETTDGRDSAIDKDSTIAEGGSNVETPQVLDGNIVTDTGVVTNADSTVSSDTGVNWEASSDDGPTTSVDAALVDACNSIQACGPSCIECEDETPLCGGPATGCICDDDPDSCASGEFCSDGVCKECNMVDHCGDQCVDCSDEFQHAQSSCDGLCVFETCDDNWWDLDDNAETPSSNGCEYYCEYASASDLPDMDFNDDNCDGIDGDLSEAVFVSKDGSDASSTCSREAPCSTITHAIERAANDGKTQVLIQTGLYSEVVSLADGIGLYGGYDANWMRADHEDSEHHATVSGGLNGDYDQYMTILARSVTSTIQNLEVVGPEASGELGNRGLSSYALYAADSTLVIENVSFTQGDGSDGSWGVAGTSLSSDAQLNG